MSLLRLPDELLLEVTDHLAFLPRYRRRELLALTTTCRRLNSVATQLLHSELCVSIHELVQVLELYVAKPHLATKVKSLELFPEEETDEDTRLSKPGFELSDVAFKSYVSKIRNSAVSEKCQTALSLHLECGTAHAATIFALALLVLPNIHTLLLGTVTWDIGLESVFISYVPTTRWCTLYDCLCEIFALLASRLTTLDLPYLESSETTVSVCSNLTHLKISFLAFVTWEDSSEDNHIQDPVHAPLPPTLQRLTIGHPKLAQLLEGASGGVLKSLVDSKEDGALPALSVLEIYVDSRDPTQDNSLFFDVRPPATQRYKKTERRLWFAVTERRVAERRTWAAVSRWTKQLNELGVQTVFHWSDYDSIFRPMTSLVSSSCYDSKALRVLEMRGGLEHLRGEAEAMGKSWREEDLERKEKEEGGEGDYSDDDFDGMACGIGFD